MGRSLNGQAKIRRANKDDLLAIAEVATQAFSGLRPFHLARKWVRACYSASSRMEYWVAEVANPPQLVGYILWIEKGGFRKEAVFELEQIAVRADFRGRGMGAKLIRTSLKGLESRLRRRGSALKLVEITTGSTQNALTFYRRVLGARPVAKIPSFFRGDEYILIARRGGGDRGGCPSRVT